VPHVRGTSKVNRKKPHRHHDSYRDGVGHPFRKVHKKIWKKMRLYLDTNILIFMWKGEADCIDRDTFTLLKDYGNSFYSSTVCVHELYAMLPMYENHRDPNDRLIIAQAMSDKISLGSSDRKFEQYTKYGLDFIFNRR